MINGRKFLSLSFPGKKSRALGLGFLLLSAPALGAVQPRVFRVVSEKSHVSFLAVGRPSLLKIKGEGKNLTGEIQSSAASIETGTNVSASFELDLTSLTSGIERRDSHMKERYLEVGKFPKAQLKVATWKTRLGSSEPFQGILSLHGVEKPVEGTIRAEKSGDQSVHSTAQFKIHLSDFAVAIPVFAGITVADEVEIEVDLEAVSQ